MATADTVDLPEGFELDDELPEGFQLDEAPSPQQQQALDATKLVLDTAFGPSSIVGATRNLGSAIQVEQQKALDATQAALTTAFGPTSAVGATANLAAALQPPMPREVTGAVAGVIPPPVSEAAVREEKLRQSLLAEGEDLQSPGAKFALALARDPNALKESFLNLPKPESPALSGLAALESGIEGVVTPATALAVAGGGFGSLVARGIAGGFGLDAIKTLVMEQVPAVREAAARFGWTSPETGAALSNAGLGALIGIGGMTAVAGRPSEGGMSHQERLARNADEMAQQLREQVIQSEAGNIVKQATGETTNATNEIQQPESVRPEPEGGTARGQTEEAGAGNRLLSPEDQRNAPPETEVTYEGIRYQRQPDGSYYYTEPDGTIQSVPAESRLAKEISSQAPTKIEPTAATEGGIKRDIVAPQQVTPSPQSLGVVHPLPGFLNGAIDALLGAPIRGKIEGWVNRLKGTIGTTLGKTFPNTTLVDRKSGELGARWISSRIAAPYLARHFSEQVLEGTGIDPRAFGTALTEDNLRSVREAFEDAGETDRASQVGTTIGTKNSPFKTEAEYQAFLNDAAVQAALERHRSLWDEVVNPMYRKAQLLDPSEPLASRGEQTGARINLNAVDERIKNKNHIVTVGQGNPLGTLRRKSPFGRQATGTGIYDTDYHSMMANTFGRQLEIANKNAFEAQLIESGNAVIGKPGENPILPDGEATVGFPLKRQTLLLKGEEGTTAVPQNQQIYVRESLAPEYKRGANADASIVPKAFQKAGDILNRAALAGLTDATVHLTNQAHLLFNRAGVAGGLLTDSLLSTFGRLDIPVILVKTLVKAFQDNREQLTRLAEIGALRASHDSTSRLNPLNRMGDFLQVADRTVRLVMDDTFTKLAKEGLVEDTETNRREFINQLGQYNKRAQGDVMRFFRDSGLGPFATAGRAFNVLGARTVALSPGAKATGTGAALGLRANALAKYVGFATLVGSLNYLLTKDKGGGVMGRPGVKIGDIDTGEDDENGRPLTIPALNLSGLGRGLRVTGIRGAMEAKRNALTPADIRDSAYRDIFNSGISPFVGPVPRFGLALGNIPAGIGIPKPSPVVAPGENQFESNVAHGLIEANPIVASIADATSGDTKKALRRQLPRFTLQPGKPAEMMAKYPEIVQKAQAAAFIDDIIGRSRQDLSPAQRKKFLHDALERLPASMREHAIQEFKRRRVWVN